MANDLPEDAYTLLDDEGGLSVKEAFEAAQGGEVVWCLSSEGIYSAPPPMAVMINPARYDELLEIEFKYQGLQK